MAPNTRSSFLPKLKIEVAVATDVVEQVIEAITAAARTGQIGDGKIFVYAVEHAVRIRTGETRRRCPLIHSTKVRGDRTMKLYVSPARPPSAAAGSRHSPLSAAGAGRRSRARRCRTRATPPGCCRDRARSDDVVPGLALFYGGLVRTKNMLSVLTQVFAIVCARRASSGSSTAKPGLHQRRRPQRFRRRLLEGVPARRRRRTASPRHSRTASSFPNTSTSASR